MILTTLDILLVSSFTLYIYLLFALQNEFTDIQKYLKKLKHDLKGIK